jgi:hypothetical protein
MSDESSNYSAYTNIWRITAIITAIYGVSFLLLPTLMFSVSRDPGFPANAGWVRWAGGVLIGLAAGAWVGSNSSPSKQRPAVIGFAVGEGLTALSLTYSAISGEYQGVPWFIWTAAVLNACCCGAMLWLLSKYKAFL